MQPTRVLTDERAVSPVIAIILMIAITVILGAIFGAFVIGSGANEAGGEPAPAARFGFDHDEAANELTVTHEGGDAVQRDRVSVRVLGESTTVASGFPNEEIQSGDSATLSGIERDDRVRLFWRPPDVDDPNEDRTRLLGSWDGPEAPG